LLDSEDVQWEGQMSVTAVASTPRDHCASPSDPFLKLDSTLGLALPYETIQYLVMDDMGGVCRIDAGSCPLARHREKDEEEVAPSLHTAWAFLAAMSEEKPKIAEERKRQTSPQT
jgi:hypothetical protein